MSQAEPAFVLTYGRSGGGKTVDGLYSFPNALWLAAPGALKPAEGVCGYSPRKTKSEPESIMQVTAMLNAGQERFKKEHITEVCVDDFSLLAERTMKLLEEKFNGFKLFGEMRNALIDFRDAARRAGVHVVLNAHAQPPTYKVDPKGLNGPRLVLGGPRLPGKMPEDMPTACDLVLRVDVDLSRIGWQGIYRCSLGDTDYVTKDRHNVTPAVAPMNLGEILRLAGYNVSRLPAIAEWQEGVVEKGAQALLAAQSDEEAKAVRVAIATACVEKYRASPQHVGWTLRDAIDRAELRRAKSRQVSNLYQLV